MAKTKFSSPTIVVKITNEARERAVQSNSGGCLIADGIREQFPQFTKITVDMATIRMSDRKRGVRYTYLTPPLAQHCLLAFDQGWINPAEEVVLRKAVQITPITSRPKASQQRDLWRPERLAELETKETDGTITKPERAALTRIRNPQKAQARPSSRGPRDVAVAVGPERATVVHGGRPIPQGEPHPNLLRGRDRHFGARLADPGQAFNEAVEQALAEKLKGSETSA